MKMFTFGGISTVVKEDNLKENFECVRDNDEELIYLSKKKYEHREEGLNFDYRYMISVLSMGEFVEEIKEDSAYCIEVYLVVSPDYLHEKVRSEIENFTGGYCEYVDILEYGLGVRMLYEDKTYSEDVMYEIINNVSCLIDPVNSFRGFYLDRFVNRAGNTGWDLIKNCLDGVSYISRLLERMEVK